MLSQPHTAIQMQLTQSPFNHVDIIAITQQMNELE